MDDDNWRIATVVLALILIPLTIGYFNQSHQIGDYRKALDEANSSIDQAHQTIESAQSSSDSADFDELHSLINDLYLPEQVSDPHPPSTSSD